MDQFRRTREDQFSRTQVDQLSRTQLGSHNPVCDTYGLHTLLGYDKKLCADVINAFVTEVMRFYKFQAKQELELKSVSLAHPGCVTLAGKLL